MLKKGKISIPLFSVRGHQRFEYKPVYYDPNKDKQGKMKYFSENESQIQIDNQATFKIKGSPIKNGFKKRNKSGAIQTMRVFIIASILFTISLYFLNKISAIFAILLIGILLFLIVYKSK